MQEQSLPWNSSATSWRLFLLIGGSTYSLQLLWVQANVGPQDICGFPPEHNNTLKRYTRTDQFFV